MESFQGTTLESLYHASEKVWPLRESPSCLVRDCNGLSVGIPESDPKAVVLYERSEAGPTEIGLQTHVLRGHSAFVTCVTCSCDGKRIASASLDRTARVWDADNGECLQLFVGHEDGVCCVAYTSDARRIATGSSDKTVRLWATDSGMCLRILIGHEGQVNGVSFSGDDARIVSGSDDKTVRVWDRVTGNCLHTLEGHTGSVLSVALCSDGLVAASGSADKMVNVWDTERGALLETLEGHAAQVYCVTFNRENTCIFSGSTDNKIGVWGVRSDSGGEMLPMPESDLSLCSLNSDGSRFIAGEDDLLTVWETANGNCVRKISCHSGSTDALSAALSLDGRLMMFVHEDTIQVWNTVTVERPSADVVLSGHSMDVTCVSISGDGKRVATGSSDHTVRVWKSDTGTCIKAFNDPIARCCCVSISDDGEFVAAGCRDGMFFVWNIHSAVSIYYGSHGGPVRCLAIATGTGGPIIASCDRNNVCMWHHGSKTKYVSKIAIPSIQRVALRNDGNIVISESDDLSIRVWIPSTATCSLSCVATIDHNLYRIAGVPLSYQTCVTYRDGVVFVWAACRNETKDVFEQQLVYLVACILTERYTPVQGTRDATSFIFGEPYLQDPSHRLSLFAARCPGIVLQLDNDKLQDWNRLPFLSSFDVSDTNVSALPPSLGSLNFLNDIKICRCKITVLPTSWSGLLDVYRPGPFPRNGLHLDDSQLASLPKGIRQAATKHISSGEVELDARVILGYLRDLRESTPASRIRMVAVGPAAAGKTLFSQALSGVPDTRVDDDDDDLEPGSTVGVDMFTFNHTLTVYNPNTRQEMEQNYHVDIWDFAGHEEYFPIHALLFSELVQYLLVIDASKLLSGSSHVVHFRKWLTSISARAPAGRVVLVLSHVDKILGWESGFTQRQSIAQEIAECGYQQAVEGLPEERGLEILRHVIVVDSRTPSFMIVFIHERDSGRDTVTECDVLDLRERLVELAIEYMSRQATFAGHVGAKDLECSPGKFVAPVVPALYLSAMEMVEKWSSQKRMRSRGEVGALLQMYSSEDHAAESNDIMTFAECCDVLKDARVSYGDEFERVISVLRSWGSLFYYGVSPAEKFNRRLAHQDTVAHHPNTLLEAKVASELVFVNPSVLVDITAHLFVRHHLKALQRTVRDPRQLRYQLFSSSVLKAVNDADTHELYERYGVASEHLLKEMFSALLDRYGLSIEGVIDLLLAMQLMYQMDMHLPPTCVPADSGGESSQSVVVPVFIIPTLLPETKPLLAFPCSPTTSRLPDSSQQTSPSYFDFKLRFNSTGLQTLIARWTMRCKSIAEKHCELRGAMWNGGCDVYGGTNTLARIHWERNSEEVMVTNGLSTGDSEVVRVECGTLRRLSCEYASVQDELYALMRVVFTSLEELLESGGTFSGIRLDGWDVPSPCNTRGHSVSISASDMYRFGRSEGIEVLQCTGCMSTNRVFVPQKYRLPFWTGCECEDIVSDDGGSYAMPSDSHTYQQQRNAVRFVGEAVIPGFANKIKERSDILHNNRLQPPRDPESSGRTQLSMSVSEHTSVALQSMLQSLLGSSNSEFDPDPGLHAEDPRLFFLLPENMDSRANFASGADNFANPCRLYVLCEAQKGPHLPEGHSGYVVGSPRPFIGRYGRQMHHVIKTLSCVMKAASFIPKVEIVRGIFGSATDDVQRLLRDDTVRKNLCRIFKWAIPISTDLQPIESEGCLDDDELEMLWSSFNLKLSDEARNHSGGLRKAPMEWDEVIRYSNGDVHRRWLCPRCYVEARERFIRGEMGKHTGSEDLSSQ